MGKRILVIITLMIVTFLTSYYVVKLGLSVSLSQTVLFGVIAIFFAIRRQSKDDKNK